MFDGCWEDSVAGLRRIIEKTEWKEIQDSKANSSRALWAIVKTLAFTLYRVGICGFWKALEGFEQKRDIV